jgi:hypothetical protein
VSKRITSEDYGVSKLPKTDVEKALTLAHEIRRFEIELYWKRATYFWTFIAIALAGYVTVLDAKDPPPFGKGDPLLTCSCVGIVFSVAWYFVNRASKYWQENWEKHVDLLEDAVMGPVYKTVLSDEKLWSDDAPRFWPPWGPYPFSVSKINQILSLFVVALFLILAAATGWEYFRIGWPFRGGWPPDLFAAAVVLVTISAVCILWRFGRTGDSVRETRAELRTTKIVYKEESEKANKAK